MENMRINALPADERPRERLARLGEDALSDRELLAIILRNGTKNKSAIGLATELLTSHGGNLAGIAELSVQELCRHDGIGPAKALELRASFALAKRLVGEGRRCFPMNCPEQVYPFMVERFRGVSQEEFHALLLDTKLSLIKDEIITMGLLDRTLIHPREVFRIAIREASKAIVICHNHPSGDPSPSKEDMQITESLVEAGEIIGINVVDHIIIGNPAKKNPKGKYWYSFLNNGVLDGIKRNMKKKKEFYEKVSDIGHG